MHALITRWFPQHWLVAQYDYFTVQYESFDIPFILVSFWISIHLQTWER